MARRCPKCGQPAPEGAQFCPNPACGTYLGWDMDAPHGGSAPGAAPGPTVPPDSARDRARGHERPPPRQPEPRPRSTPDAAPLAHVATVAPEQTSVAPGDTAALTLTVSNTGSVVDEVEVRVSGPLAAYTTVAPASVPVYPGDQATTQVTVTPPHAVSPPAGPHPVVLRVASNRGGSVSEHVATVEIGTFTGMVARLVPPQSRGRSRRFECVAEVTNQGNSGLQATATPRDDNRRLRWPRGARTVHVPPGSTGQVPVEGRAPFNWFGEPDVFPFDVTVGGNAEPVGRTPPLTERHLSGKREQLAVLAGWQAWFLALTALAAAVAAVVLVLGPALLDAGRAAVDQVQELLGDDQGLADPPAAEQEEAGGGAEQQPPENANGDFCQASEEARESLEDQVLDGATVQEINEVLQIAAGGNIDPRLAEQAVAIQTAGANGDVAALQEALDEVADLCG